MLKHAMLHFPTHLALHRPAPRVEPLLGTYDLQVVVVERGRSPHSSLRLSTPPPHTQPTPSHIPASCRPAHRGMCWPRPRPSRCAHRRRTAGQTQILPARLFPPFFRSIYLQLNKKKVMRGRTWPPCFLITAVQGAAVP